MNVDTIFFADTFMNSIGVNSPQQQAFLARINQNGECMWAKNIDRHRNYYSIASEEAFSVSPGNTRSDDIHAVYVSGKFLINPSILSDTLPQTAPLDEYCFIAKYNELGSLKWIKKISSLRSYVSYGEGDNIQNNNICVDENDNIYFSGNFSGSSDFSGMPINSSDTNTRDEFISEFDLNGNLKWFKQTKTPSNGSIYAYSTDLTYYPGWEALNHDNLYVCASFNKAVDFDSFHLTRSDSNASTFFLAKLASPPSSVQRSDYISHEVSIYPNPATNTLDIASVESPSHFNIVDALGRTVISGMTLDHGTLTLNIANLPNGIYFVRVERADMRGIFVDAGKIIKMDK